VLQHRRHGIAFERDNPLVTLRGIGRYDRNGKPSATDKLPKGSVRQFAFLLCGSPHGLLTSALDNDEFDRTAALNLQDQGAFELQRRR